MHPTLKLNQPAFQGNWNDLEAFLLLADSPIRSEARETALHVWERYKLKRQYHVYNKGIIGKRGRVWGKGNYISSLTAKAIDLTGIHLNNICIGYADFRGVNFDQAIFGTEESRGWIAMKGAKLRNASMRGAKLSSARLMDADLSFADLTDVELIGADLQGANLNGATLVNAKLQGANLQNASLVGAKLQGADISGSRVYGVAAWDIELDDNINLRRDLIVTPTGQSDIRVDSIEVAQFVYLLLNNSKVRDVLDTVCKKGVLILGRFTGERKKILDAIKQRLRELDYLPILFDFDRSPERNFTETIVTLAGMSLFVIADITNPRSSPLELQATVPVFNIPFVPIIQAGEDPFSMFSDLQNSFGGTNEGRLIDLFSYTSETELINVFKKAIIEPALQRSATITAAKAKPLKIRRASDYEG